MPQATKKTPSNLHCGPNQMIKCMYQLKINRYIQLCPNRPFLLEWFLPHFRPYHVKTLVGILVLNSFVFHVYHE